MVQSIGNTIDISVNDVSDLQYYNTVITSQCHHTKLPLRSFAGARLTLLCKLCQIVESAIREKLVTTRDLALT